MPTKVSPNGSFRFHRKFGKLEVNRASGVKGEWELPNGKPNKKVQDEWHYRNGLLTRLWEKEGGLEILQKFQDGEIEIEEIIAADKQDRLTPLATDLIAYRPLWSTWEEMIPKMRTSKGRVVGGYTQASYVGAMRRLRNLTDLGDNATISDLRRVDWGKAIDTWEDDEGSAAGWNHIGRGLSRFLSLALGDKFHPLRREVMRQFPKMQEHARVPHLTKQMFYRVLDMVPTRFQSYFRVLALTGLRIGELCALTRADLDNEPSEVDVNGEKVRVYGIQVQDAKTPAGHRKVYVAEQFWPWVLAAVPTEYTHWAIREQWNAAVDRAFPEGKKDIRVHDLRHFIAQRLTEDRTPEAHIQAQLGHADASITRKYAMESAKKEVAVQVARIFPALEASHDDIRRALVRKVAD